TITDNQQQLSASKPNPSITDKAAISAGTIKTDTGKAQISARVKQVPSNGITGIVIDSKGQPVAGATVVIIGTKTGTATDENGNFSIPTNDSTVLANIYALNYAAIDQRLR